MRSVADARRGKEARRHVINADGCSLVSCPPRQGSVSAAESAAGSALNLKRQRQRQRMDGAVAALGAGRYRLNESLRSCEENRLVVVSLLACFRTHRLTTAKSDCDSDASSAGPVSVWPLAESGSVGAHASSSRTRRLDPAGSYSTRINTQPDEFVSRIREVWLLSPAAALLP